MNIVDGYLEFSVNLKGWKYVTINWKLKVMKESLTFHFS